MWRFHKRIAPGVWLNGSKFGPSITIGSHGVYENFNRRGMRPGVRLGNTGFYVQGNRLPYGRLGRPGGITALGCVAALVRLMIAVVLLLLSGLTALELAAQKSFAGKDLQFLVVLWLGFFAIPALWRRIRRR